MPNRLAKTSSPYLQQHASNPIDWWPWSEAAFASALERDVPVLISVGYSACHWCHVMAHESFEDADVAAYVNEHFVAIKVDREERPDVDAVYMRATQALTGQGGWPMTVFATPDGRPFFAGTYYPPEPGRGMPSFMQVLQAMAGAWADRHDEVVGSAQSIAAQLAEINKLPAADAAPPVWDALDSLSADFDLMHGGFGDAPKFPAPLVVDALLVKGEPGSLDMAQRTLDAMARGGIHDQVGGGFHRYSVDAAWVVPHFEKMLYDNALLLGAYARGWRRTPGHDTALRGQFERAARGIVEWLRREMTVPSGGFAASLDADSADSLGMPHEGIYYVWNHDLLVDALGEEDAAWAEQVFHVTSSGTFEHGLSTLQLRGVPDEERLAEVSRRLLDERRNRFAPPRDDKVVTSWNGWMIDSLVQAALIFDEPSWLELATDAAETLWGLHWAEHGLRRSSHNGVVSDVPAFAEDYGALALAFGHLGAALGDAGWLKHAVRLLEQALERFGAEDGGFYDAAETGLFSRPRDVTDNPTPSGTSALVAALRTVGLLADRQDFLDRADAAARTTWGTVAATPRFAPAALTDVLIADEARQGLRPAVAVVIDESGTPLNRAAVAAWRMAPAGSVVVNGRPGTKGFAHHFDDRGPAKPGDARIATEGGKITRASIGGSGQVNDAEYDEHEDVETDATVYVCRGTTCFAPATSVKQIRAALWSRAS
ncbi:thioredoxin domain-containing protein [Nigerium massiliense]|uniref:thioredoxin domain-containing protein n=1 Tax=Nigerium massiliense TaxID=1522317 RepID=UPI00058EB47E|nr:thioredoxin domain-containing protein [Nigerium massiliense]